MEIIERVLKATIETLFGNVGISNEDFIIGLSTLIIILASFFGSFYLFYNKFKVRPSLSIVGALGITIGVITLFCIICIIVQH